jgi:hypothetical protein
VSSKLSVRQLELQYRFKLRVLDVAGSIIQTAIRSGTWVGVAYLLTTAVGRLAGKFTFADIGVRLLGDFRISEALAYVLAIGSGGWAWKERNAKRNTIDRLSRRIEQLEQQLDPGRTSSKLTRRGTTRPEDVL